MVEIIRDKQSSALLKIHYNFKDWTPNPQCPMQSAIAATDTKKVQTLNEIKGIFTLTQFSESTALHHTSYIKKVTIGLSKITKYGTP